MKTGIIEIGYKQRKAGVILQHVIADQKITHQKKKEKESFMLDLAQGIVRKGLQMTKT